MSWGRRYSDPFAFGRHVGSLRSRRWGRYVAFEHQFAAVKQALAEKFEVEADGDALIVESDSMPYGMAACRVVFGEV